MIQFFHLQISYGVCYSELVLDMSYFLWKKKQTQKNSNIDDLELTSFSI